MVFIVESSMVVSYLEIFVEKRILQFYEEEKKTQPPSKKAASEENEERSMGLTVWKQCNQTFHQTCDLSQPPLRIFSQNNNSDKRSPFELSKRILQVRVILFSQSKVRISRTLEEAGKRQQD